MNTPQTRHRRTRFSTDAERWQAVANRDLAADGRFVYSVCTTGVYCRPVCPARLALRKNVRFHATCTDAEAAGFRPCKRCRPGAASLSQRQASLVAEACRQIEQSAKPLSLHHLARAAGTSRYHFHRLFKAHTGTTPKRYASTHRTNRVRTELKQRDTVTNAIYRAGFNASSRFYESSIATLGMTPKTFRAGGNGIAIRFAIGQCWLGGILVAASEKGICAILLGDDPAKLAHDLQDRFPKAQLIGGDRKFDRLIAQVIGFVSTPAAGLNLPLDIRGTAFQCRVWDALRKIPAGSTATYAETAQQIGKPTAARAVARAIAANPLAVAIPCHRVIRKGGSLSGYRWGVQRKRKLLNHERPARSGRAR